MEKKVNYFLWILIILVFVQCTNTDKPITYLIHFSELQTNSTASLRGLFVVDENVVWASGSEGTVLLTTDGGNNWKNCSIQGAEENDFRSICAWDKNKALVFGINGPSFGYLSEDGGQSWQVIFKDTTDGLFFNSLKFADARIGLAISDPIEGKPFLIKTIDGGKTWKQITTIPDAIEGEANFAASNTCIEFLPSGNGWMVTGGAVARCFYSSDFGENWKVAETTMISGTPAAGVFSVCFKNDSEGVMVGGAYDQPQLNKNIAAYTTDGGKSWTSSVIMPKEYRSCVQFISEKRENLFLSIGKTGCDISTDNGKTWNFVSDKGYYTFKVIPGKLEGFFAGDNGRINKVMITN